MKEVIRVAVTGAAGQIGYAIVFRIASGGLFGSQQKVRLQLLEVPAAETALQGVVMEIRDAANPLLEDILATSDPRKAFEGADWTFCIGSIPRKPGMERAELLGLNGKIFVEQGRILSEVASPDARVLVVGNPCNTNAWIARQSGPGLPADRWFAMTRLDENRARARLAEKAGVPVGQVDRLAVWGNHSPTMYPDFTNARIGGKPVTDVIRDRAWLEGDFLRSVQQRGAEVLKARGLSSAASAAHAALDTVRTLHQGTKEGDWTSVAVTSDGSYGVPRGLMCSFPVRAVGGGKWEIVPGLKLDDFGQKKLAATVAELEEERAAAAKAVGLSA
ncbi:MAG: malate dehydrogenase [Verrucomicrobia bacterium]|nr:malate dehydrogenase [Verrucomicrobiota bacterium]NBR62868.1 malate dehydrogenase [Verrucomicrobiota bacterium]